MSRFSLADKVRLKGSPDREGIITDVYDDGAETQYEVFFSAGETTTYAEGSLLSPDDFGAASGPVDLLQQWRLGSAEEFRSFLTLAKLRTPIANNLYSFLASRTELLPYQFKPVLKLIESPYSRILVADEVGLGKTIEAGIILMELNARALLRQILVVCPSALLGKWRSELRDRFEWEFDILDGTAFRERIGELGVRSDRILRGIASLELLRREENMAALTNAAPRFDAVIVDEAHHMRNQGTMSNFLGETLSGLTDTLLFLTATPLNLGERDFFELLHLLVPQEFTDFEVFRELIEPNESINNALRVLRRGWPPDFEGAATALREIEAGSQAGRFQRNSRFRDAVSRLERASEGVDDDRASAVETQRIIASLNTLGHAFTRTKKREVSEHFPTRRAHRISITFTHQEMAFYEAVTRWATHIGYEADIPLGFIVTSFQRQAASCIPAMGAKLEEAQRLSEVRFFDEELIDIDPSLLDDAAISHTPAAPSPNGEGDGSGLGISTVDLTGSRARLLQELANAWREVQGIDTKYEEFEEGMRRLFEEGEDRILVFAFFVRTIDYLEERLSSLEVNGKPVTVHKMYGLTKSDDRHSVINRFRTREGPQIFLSSEVGSEGLDFQFCSVMVNYDLPWNPMRVEQRIGRLDRYGQESDLIQIFNLVVTDTIEDRIFYRLYERIGIFERSIGDLEAILGDPVVGSSLAGLQRDVLMRSLTPEEQEQRTNQIANAILNLQQEHEEFDEQSRKFLGIDDVFTEQFNDIRESERYITAAELRNFVEQFLGRRFPRLSLRSIDGEASADGSEVLELVNSEDREFIDFLTDAYHRDQNASRLHDRLISHLAFGERCALTFDSHRAMVDRTLEFFSIHHPIVRAAVMEESEREDLLPTGQVHLPNGGSRDAPRLFFIFEIESRGLKDEVELLAAVVTPDGQIDEGLSADLLAFMGDAVTPAAVEHSDLLTDETVDRAHAAARTWAGQQVARRKAELEQVVDEAIDAQLESLRLGHERTIARVETQLRDANERGQERIARMRQGQLVNVRRQYEAKTRELESRRGADVGHRIVAAGLIA